MIQVDMDGVIADLKTAYIKKLVKNIGKIVNYKKRQYYN